MIKWQGNPKEVDKKGIYGIYIEDRLIYIGSTYSSFSSRLSSHNSSSRTGNNILYKMLRQNQKKRINMRPMVITDYVRTSKSISAQDLKWMELALISCFRPVGNTCGTKTSFIF